jgi:D-serine deaminase-like pyridoxal phosphate-dependent protein
LSPTVCRASYCYVAAALEMLNTSPLPAGASWSVFVKVDCGYHRAGLLPEHAVECAAAVASSAHTTYGTGNVVDVLAGL